MLYDPKWNKHQPKPDAFSLDGLISWLETKDPCERFDYFNFECCLLAQYFRAAGLRHAEVDELRVGWFSFGVIPRKRDLPQDFNAIAMAAHTFGHALSLAYRVRASREITKRAKEIVGARR